MDILSGRRHSLGACMLRAGLTLAEVPYSATMRLRRWMYHRGTLNRKRVCVPVICVGNITTGGTGKTPMVAWVVRYLKEIGKNPAILTRGYKSVAGLSDEAELLKKLTGANVVVNPNRASGAKSAIQSGADMLVMDDGFQHLRLQRDLNIVLVDASNPFGFDHCLPRGLLREPPSALRDAHVIVITRSDTVPPEELADLGEQLANLAPNASIHQAAHVPTTLIDGKGKEFDPQELAGKKVFAFCGIGQPESFFATLKNLGARLVGQKALDDHAEYTDEIIDSITLSAKNIAADLLVTTQKDYVKLKSDSFALPIQQLVVEMEITEGRDKLIQKIKNTAH